VAVLLLRSPAGSIQQVHEFRGDLQVGTTGENRFRLPRDLLVAPHHVVISRSSFFQVPVLIDLAGDEARTLVNGRRVVRLKTLRHRDRIELGKAHLEFWELVVRQVSSGSPLIGQRCLVCYASLQPGDRVITCPRCRSPHHQDCWFNLSLCSYYGCGYPVQQTMRRVLAPKVHFERLEEESEPVETKKMCQAGNPRDQAPFKAHEWVAYCPDCGTLFHTECWLTLQQCPVCGYDIAGLIRQALDPTIPVEAASLERSSWANR